jgi:hypothetical protein
MRDDEEGAEDGVGCVRQQRFVLTKTAQWRIQSQHTASFYIKRAPGGVMRMASTHIAPFKLTGQLLTAFE